MGKRNLILPDLLRKDVERCHPQLSSRTGGRGIYPLVPMPSRGPWEPQSSHRAESREARPWLLSGQWMCQQWPTADMAQIRGDVCELGRKTFNPVIIIFSFYREENIEVPSPA